MFYLSNTKEGNLEISSFLSIIQLDSMKSLVCQSLCKGFLSSLNFDSEHVFTSYSNLERELPDG